MCRTLATKLQSMEELQLLQDDVPGYYMAASRVCNVVPSVVCIIMAPINEHEYISSYYRCRGNSNTMDLEPR